MKTAIFLSGQMQAHLVKEAIKKQIETNRKAGFKENDPEVKLLVESLPAIDFNKALPIMSEEVSHEKN